MRPDTIRKTHEAYGMIGYRHTSGNTDLVGVDYAQGHFVTLTVKTAICDEDETHDTFHAQKYIVELAMSEVQWASFIANPNRGDGVPCTLTFYRDPMTGEVKKPRFEKEAMSRIDRSRDAVTARAKAISTKIKEAQVELERLLAGGPLKKGDMKRLQELLFFANQDIDSNLGYFVERVEETLDGAVADAKAQVDAHADYVIRNLGMRALGERLNQALEAGVDPSQIGIAMTALLTPPVEDAS